MPRGGYRPAAGRTRKTPAAPAKPAKADDPPRIFAMEVRRAAKTASMTPLDYMLAVLNDADVDPNRRDRMAIAAAPYVHPKVEPVNQGKKERAQEAATTAERGTDWETLLN
jgi:hypothetical protein